MATLAKQALLTGKITELNAITAQKTTAFCLAALNQLAARLGGAASLVEAQSIASHGRVLSSSSLHKKIAAIRQSLSKTRELLELTKIECEQVHKRNSVVNGDLKPVDTSVSNAMFKAVSCALRSAQAATLGIAAVTNEDAPSPLSAKADMLAKIYLSAQKQSQLAKITRPYLILMNQVAAAATRRGSK